MNSSTEEQKGMETKLALMAKRAREESGCRYNNLMHLINEDSLKANFQKLGRNRAEGVDEVSWKEYGKQLKENTRELLGRMKKMSCRPQPVRRVYIEKENGKKRAPGIPATEDKMVQRTMVQILEAICEQDFYEVSCGFRPKKGCHQALKEIGQKINFKAVNYVIEADIEGYFDNVEHQALVDLMKRRINDPRFLRYIARFLKSGYMEEEEIKASKKGTPQGGNLSPMLANIFLHYVLDEWFEEEVKSQLKGYASLVRYCDDFIILIQKGEEAREVERKIKERSSLRAEDE